MSTRKRAKNHRNLLKQIWKLFSVVCKRLINWLLRSLLVIARPVFRQARLSKSGFVLPTVAMVSIVVVLLTTALVIRSFSRSENASNVRVNEAVLNAATPALDRARAKIEALFSDSTLPQGTPSDLALYNAISNNVGKYTLGDEKPLKLVRDIGNGQGGSPNGTIEKLANNSASTLENDETLTTAWRFPVDTDNNGKYDSYTLYGIYFRSPTRDNTGKFNRHRNPLEARTPPMDASTVNRQCAAGLGTSASLVGDSGWYKAGGKLKKSFYVYTATVPITNTNPGTGYETYKGNKGFSALEFQQDRTRIPLTNNAVVYEDDLEITPGPAFRLNGRIVTNSNLLAGHYGNGVELYQVSSPDSCYYEEENSKIIVGGNVASGGFTGGSNDVQVHLFEGVHNLPDETKAISSTNKSTTNTSTQVGYNTQAYAQRIARLVDAQIANSSSTDPTDVQKAVNAVPTSQQAQERRKRLEIYFRNRTRRVPFAEVAYSGNTLLTNGTNYATTTPLQGSGDTLRPIDAWMYPTDPSDGKTSTNYTKLTLNTGQLQATEPQKEKQRGTEEYLGDRIQVGNNLPALWFKNGAFVGADAPQNISGVNWTEGTGTRYRQTRVQALADLGSTDRDGFWELAAATRPTSSLDNRGGLRVATGAGVYERKNSFLPPPTYDNPNTAAIEKLPTYNDPATPIVEAYPMVWPDSMPMSPGAGSQVFDNVSTPPQWTTLPATLPTAVTPTIDPNTPKFAKGDLRMRATAVYHYTQDSYDSATDFQTPIACVSSYYDPTNNVTARNPNPLPDVSGLVVGSQPAGARSNNGVAYPAPTTTASSLGSVSGPNPTTDLFNGNENSTTLLGKLYYQANLKFPNGRFVNEPLRNALTKRASNQNLTLSEQSAIDSTICSLQILDGTITAGNTLITNGAIREVAFLDARQIKAIHTDIVDDPTTPAVNEGTNAVETFTTEGDANLTGNYDLSIEQRQPLEIRATALDINLLRQQTIAGGLTQEYLLPNSGIIYASRDDALPDLSDKSSNNIETRKLLSPTDFKLDPTRRPNAILLTNGGKLWRQQSFREAEKGLILATNLPVYVHGNFNLHTYEEFTNTLDDDWGDFYQRTKAQINPDFACRPGDSRLPNCNTGDEWRSAKILADAITLLSDNFRFGFRNDGDYDLRNNNGNQDSIDKRKHNGFWNNNFVTSRNFQDSRYSGNTGNTDDDSSYFNNFVTPIQRRVNGFPEYVMEICRKLPVSECQPADWVVGFDMNGNGNLDDTVTFDVDGNNVVDSNDTEKRIKANQLGKALVTAGKSDTNSDSKLNNSEVGWSTAFVTGGNSKSPLARLGAGTTATPALVEADRRYARRVAFARNNYQVLVLQQFSSGNAVAKPLGVGCPLDANVSKPDPDKNGCEYPNTATWTAGINYGTTANNALWFRTTNNTTGEPGVSADITYSNNRPLYYLPPNLGGTKLKLPETPDIPGVPSLNLPEGNESASDYSECVGSGGSSTSSQSYEPSIPFTSPGCPATTADAINDFLGVGGAYGLLDLPPTDTTSLSASGGTVNASTTTNVNVITIPGKFDNDIEITLNADNPNAIFVMQQGSGLSFGGNCSDDTGLSCAGGVKLILNGVSPNNVFWAVNGAIKFENVKTPHRLAGNFIGKGAGSEIGANTIIEGGRLLGMSNIASYGTTGIEITAVASDEQVSLVPVLQIHRTNGNPPNDPNSGGTASDNTRWIMPANDAGTTFNLVAAGGDTPARGITSNFESNGGLYNYVRFLENWKDQTVARINGSFIQLKRSAYATAPWSGVSSNNQGGIFNYRQAYRDAYGTLSSGWGYLPHYVAPKRSWGYDVGLLSQSPDLFDQKFTQQPTTQPNEFFREVGRDDPWIQNLLCAAVGNQSAPGSYTYTDTAVDDRQSLNCPLPLGAYQ